MGLILCAAKMASLQPIGRPIEDALSKDSSLYYE